MKKFSLHYYLLQQWVAVGFKCYFKNHIVIEEERFRENIPVIYCANHQNAFTDALLIAEAVKTQPASLVRADVFQDKFARFLLESIKMIPVYRMRDGYQTLSKNAAAFARSRAFLARGGTLIVFPEGNHGALKKLRPLKHGAARIAADTAAYHPGCERVAIRPVGLEYSEHSKFRSNVCLRFGRVIEVKKSDFPEGSSSSVSVRTLTGSIEASLKKLIYHQDAPRKNGLIFNWINKVYPVNVMDRQLFKVHCLRAREAAELFNGKELSDEILTGLRENYDNLFAAGFPGFGYQKRRDFLKPLAICALLWITVPAALAAYGIPYFALKLLQYRIADRQFRTSIKFTLGLFVFPLWTLMLAGMLNLWFTVYQSVALTGLSILCGIGALIFRDAFYEMRRVYHWQTRVPQHQKEAITEETRYMINLAGR